VVVTDDHPLETEWATADIVNWIAGQGVNRANGFVATPLCAPSRSSIFTGRYAHNHGVRSNSLAAKLNQLRPCSALVDADILSSGTATFAGDGLDQSMAQVLPHGRLYADGETYGGLIELSEVLGLEGNPWSLWSADLPDGRVALGVLRERQDEGQPA
jgi:hypothetical protein